MIVNIILYVLFALLFFGVVTVIIFDNGDSGTKLAWLLAITLLPVLGVVLYLMLGMNYRNHPFFHRRHEEAIRKFHAEFDDKIKAIQEVEKIGAAYAIGRDCHVGDTITLDVLAARMGIGRDEAASMMDIVCQASGEDAGGLLISANDDLVICGGSISIEAPKDGVHANDSLRICEATLDVTDRKSVV